MLPILLRCPACSAGVPLPAIGAGAGAPRCPACGHEVREQDGVLVLDGLPGHGDYPPEVYDVIAPVEDRHWWHASRNDVITLALEGERRRRGLRTLIEVGCGTGFVLAHLERMGFRVCGLDMQIEGLRHARARTTAPLLRSGRPEIPLAEPVDALALCDVLEHTDEGPLLAACRQAIRPGGLLLVTVPALPSLWSLEDEMSGHKRRYTRATLRRTLGKHGFRVVTLRPFHTAVTPLAWWFRTSRKRPDGERPDPVEFFSASLAPPGPLISGVMRSVLWVENRLGALLPLPLGSSLLALAEPVPDEAP
ncbi:MAG: class I SAM-dependent methyltransferase [Planctomycetota bacterium]